MGNNVIITGQPVKTSIRLEKNGQLRINMPSFIRKNLFTGMQSAEVEIDVDQKGKYVKLRPLAVSI
ncbi:MAG: hypothetical protein MPEBLZ_04389 [Candidatus Methanoperedens nitroreducens]|uniref:Uncharacterized protein n=1 Tax=Candidatus Methanoperedens nitratireducens TaxID=1392998 RepID=A0A0P7ZZN9_9EURY|nr:MAG: hypothetical protein F9K14_03225 [Candidatus Methanoperedens sp.]KPQ41075.1 MAG: hypothetical protein MPEBLZ_04389 [Candidatus Methanoperedens sp. BLZ1]MBZ0175242.1 hypothetical protein [Candidatus Methanoperedens nitroreducens]MCX9076514.1 hypothetical protein [Candidatus Methanoperedens sp.]